MTYMHARNSSASTEDATELHLFFFQAVTSYHHLSILWLSICKLHWLSFLDMILTLFSSFALQQSHTHKIYNWILQISCWLFSSVTSGDVYLTGQRDYPYPAAQLTTASLVIETGLDTQPCINRLALLQGYDTSTDPLRSELLWCWVGVEGKGNREGDRRKG